MTSWDNGKTVYYKLFVEEMTTHYLIVEELFVEDLSVTDQSTKPTHKPQNFLVKKKERKKERKKEKEGKKERKKERQK